MNGGANGDGIHTGGVGIIGLATSGGGGGAGGNGMDA